MRILFLGNNWVGWQVADWLVQNEERVVGAVLHPPARQQYGTELVNLMSTNSIPMFTGPDLQQPDMLERIEELEADLALSLYFGYILKSSFISLFPNGVINLHPSYLPYNKGAHPNVWSLIDGTPAGVTLHYIDDGVDTGDIIAQRRIDVEPVDTAKTLYRKSEIASFDLFRTTWPKIRMGKTERLSQSAGVGTFHRAKDISRLDRIDLEQTYTVRELLNLLRARTFPPYPGAYFEEDGRKVYVRVELSYEEQ